MTEEKDELENVGAIWKHQSKAGKEYLSIVFRGDKYIGFPNRNKKTDKHPDYTIHKKVA